MRWAGVGWSLLLLGAALSCGGRFDSTGASGSGGDDDGRAGSASSSNGGKPSKGQGGSRAVPTEPPTGHAGSSSTGGTTVVGTAGTASSSGGACSSGPIGCPVGYIATFDDRGCFTVCVPGECNNVMCSPEPCEPGQHLEQLSDECCPSCVSNVNFTCAEAQVAYQGLRQQVIEKYQLPSCSEGGGCALFWESNRCFASCGSPIRLGSRDFAEEELGNWAAANCGACPKFEPPPCPEPPAYGCVAGSCQFL